jgi:drug/metabolite transporter (DMT)-like permease
MIKIQLFYFVNLGYNLQHFSQDYLVDKQKRGNLLGLAAILLWSTLALFTVLTSDIPPFQLVSISFFVASFIGLFMLRIQKHSFKVLFQIPFSA